MTTKKGNRLRTATGAITATGVAALAFLGVWEGNKLVAYRDVIGVWTACQGETQGIKPGMRFTKAECDEININAAIRYLPEKCVKTPMSDKTYIAFLSFGYNLGMGPLCKNIAPLYDAGRWLEACQRMLRYNTAGGVVWKGLTRRRQAEFKLCTEGVTG